MDNNFLNPDDFKDLFAELEASQQEEEEMDEEMAASNRRYEEIIKKHEL